MFQFKKKKESNGFKIIINQRLFILRERERERRREKKDSFSCSQWILARKKEGTKNDILGCCH